MIPPLINGTRHSWGQIALVLFGRPVIGITEINYTQTKEKEDFFGAGTSPVHRGQGQKKATASIKLYKYEVDAIMAAAKAAAGINADLTDIAPFDIAVTYTPVGSDLVKTDVIKNCEFTEQSVATKAGDRMIEVNLPLITSHINYKI